jgi:hypothetical protein
MAPIRKIARKTLGPLQRKAFAIANERRRGAIHLFLLSPPLSGSTVFKQLIDTSPQVTSFSGNGEGQTLPAARDILMGDNRWDPGLQVDWGRVKRVFNSYWSPLKPIRFEKSPPHIIRAGQIERAFENSRFFISIRDPYAVIEGVLRRKWPFSEFGPQSTPAQPASPGAAAAFWIRAAQAQRENLERLGNTLFFRYEDLTEGTEQVLQKILRFVPELERLSPDTEFSAHNVTGRPIVGLRNLNAEKIRALSRENLAEINDVLGNHEEILTYFGYKLIQGNDY